MRQSTRKVLSIPPDWVGWLALVWFVLSCLALLASCQTYEAVTAAPEEFWITLETILGALWSDVVAIGEFVVDVIL